MKYKICLVLMLFLLNSGYGQIKYEWGAKFPFDPKTESNPAFVLADNYNHYLLTVINTDGMLANRRIVLRKFDQKNQLVDTYNHVFPQFDANTLQSYLGFAETNNGKVAVFTKTYSGTAKKSVIYKHVFDKATSEFTSTEMASNPVLSASKSGDADLRKSENGNYIGINYKTYRAKDEPEKNMMMVIDANTLNVVWQKEFAFDDKYYTKTFAVTNSGKVVFVRDASGWKKDNYLVLGTPDGQEIKALDPGIMLQEPKAVSIGAQEYILAFNYPSKGIRSGDYGNLLLFDLQSGKTVQNAKIPAFGIAGLEEVQMRNITMQNNEIQVFSEAKVEAKMPPPTIGNGGFNSGFPEKAYYFGPSYLLVLSMDGALKFAKKLPVDEKSAADFYHSFGMVNIKGKYYLNTGNYNGFYSLDAAGNYEKSQTGTINFYPSDPFRDSNVKFVDQLVHYFPDGNRLLFARIINDSEMSLVSVFGMN